MLKSALVANLYLLLSNVNDATLLEIDALVQDLSPQKIGENLLEAIAQSKEDILYDED